MRINSISKIVSVVLVLQCVIILGIEDKTEIGGLPYCGPDHVSTENLIKKLVLVSTLDGQLSALDASNGGSLLWSVKTGPEPLLSSSIHRLELSKNGQWIRMIPSLSGSLYRFNGESMEAVPITTDSLLHSSAFLLSEGVVISGGKETRIFGVDPRTGRVLYECSMNMCGNVTSDGSDVIVVRKLIQTVRAIEPQTGSEKWNFSVGQHELKLFLDENAECHGTNVPVGSPEVDVKVIVPEGLVCGVSDSNLLWTYKFDAPVVSAWQFKDKGKMVSVDLFGGSSWQYGYSNMSPMLYIGMHNKQLYIQESVVLQRMLGEKPSSTAQIPWKPVAATGTALGLVEIKGDSVTAVSDDSTTALSVLYASEYVNGNGYYLYADPGYLSNVEEARCITNQTNNNTISDDNIQTVESLTGDEGSEEEDTPVQVMIVSLWFWWKEVVLISISTALFVNIIIQKFTTHIAAKNTTKYLNSQEVINMDDISPTKHDKDSGIDVHSPARSHSDPGPVASTDFTSRYLTDFEPVHCLGRGGFGVVFEAKNKIDECHYAVKRIPLPNRTESRERVMREVKALAKLDHHNIVRYFNAWLECPPPGWQEQQDKAWPISAPSFYSDATSIDLTEQLKQTDAKPDLDLSSSESFALLNLRNRNSEFLVESELEKGDWQNENDSFIHFESTKSAQNDCEDSFIQFESTKSGHNNDASIISMQDVEETRDSTFCSQNTFGLRRPMSLNVSRGGDITFPSKPSSRMYLYIQMQLCQKESLREWLRRETLSRERKKVLDMFLQIVEAVEYVHLQELIHRDLKPSNIFFSLDGQIKIGDFGLVTAMTENDQIITPLLDSCGQILSEKHTAKVGTQLYMSPEQSAGLPYNYKVDIYSLGVILFELLVPFKTDMERVTVLTSVRENKLPVDFQNTFSEEFELLKLMLSHQPDQRPTTFGIKASPPFRNIGTTEDNSAWHFDLPPRRRTSFRTLSSSSSGESNESHSHS